MPRPILFILCFALAAASLPAADAPAATATRVGRHTIHFAKPPTQVPTQKMSDGALLGNGDLGVVVAGGPEKLAFFIGKNDFWGLQTQAPMAVGRVEVEAPGLEGATYQGECNMEHGRWNGRFEKGGTALAAAAWVEARANRLVLEFANEGTNPVTLRFHPVRGGAEAQVPGRVNPSSAPLLAGCEQHGGRRWFLRGDMADLKIEPKVLAETEIAARAQSSRGASTHLDGHTALPLEMPAISDAFTITAWLKVETFDPREADYLVSKGEWNQALSLGLSAGKPRLAVNGTFLQDDGAVLPNEWTHLAGVFGGGRMALYRDGKLVKQLGGRGSEGMEFLYAPDGDKPGTRKIGFASRLLGQQAEANSVTFAPGARIHFVAAILSDLDAPDPLAAARTSVEAAGGQGLERLRNDHEAWWKEFWAKSWIDIPDKVIEQHWYAAQYTMACCSRPHKVAPGLWGNWITRDDPAWHGDFHLNYNFQAPFYGVYAANHPELVLPLCDAIGQSVKRGQAIAAKRGWKGVHFPVSIGPWGMCPEGDDADWGQRSNAAYAALNFIWYYQYTQDKAWLQQTGYPYLREVEKFWTDYLKLEDGRYVIVNDSIHEGSGADFNPLLSLGLVRTLYANLLEMSEALGADADLRPKWQDILARLSGWPTQERGGRTVFRYTERGMAWCEGNTLGIQHIFPAGAIGLGADPKLLETSRNMIDAMGRWNDGNGSSSWYPACARVGYAPERILSGLRAMYDRHSMPNRLPNFGGGGIENVSATLGVTEMLFQSHDGLLRWFPCWPTNQDAAFGTLRGRGAVLASGRTANGVITEARFLSEKGGPCRIANPWPGKIVRIYRDGGVAESVSGEQFTLSTKAGEKLDMRAR